MLNDGCLNLRSLAACSRFRLRRNLSAAWTHVSGSGSNSEETGRLKITSRSLRVLSQKTMSDEATVVLSTIGSRSTFAKR